MPRPSSGLTPEQQKEKRKKYLQDNKERIAAKAKEYRLNNLARLNAKAAAWRLVNRERLRAGKLEWTRQNPEKIHKHQQRRYAKMRLIGWNDSRKNKSPDAVKAYERKRSQERRKTDPHIKVRRIVGNALRDKKLFKAPCEICGIERVEAHHGSYAEPLCVTWLCKSHHRAWHRIFIANN